ncbi:hypothetical protein BC943DRAFT_348089 [Umbelopsis sp. AD052]|nr:hypothetical protein BC943DRAFT_348089 [Umbelopsis sp. AD052]
MCMQFHGFEPMDLVVDQELYAIEAIISYEKDNDIDMKLSNKRRHTFYSDDEKTTNALNASATGRQLRWVKGPYEDPESIFEKKKLDLEASRSTVYNFVTARCNLFIKPAQFQPVERNSEEKFSKGMVGSKRSSQKTDLDFTTITTFWTNQPFSQFETSFRVPKRIRNRKAWT